MCQQRATRAAPMSCPLLVVMPRPPLARLPLRSSGWWCCATWRASWPGSPSWASTWRSWASRSTRSSSPACSTAPAWARRVVGERGCRGRCGCLCVLDGTRLAWARRVVGVVDGEAFAYAGHVRVASLTAPAWARQGVQRSTCIGATPHVAAARSTCTARKRRCSLRRSLLFGARSCARCTHAHHVNTRHLTRPAAGLWPC